jgi:hypothetical protein
MQYAFTMQFLKKSNVVDYIHIYDVYKSPYKTPIYNYFVTT